MINYIQLRKYAELSGYSEKAIRDKIYEGVWVEGIHFCKAPDRKIMINIEKVELWLQGKNSLALLNENRR